MKVLPFPCTRPAPEVAAEVAAPPYDVFDRDEAAAYVQERPLSFVNIDRPETQFPPSQDMYAPEVYARAAELIKQADEQYSRLLWEFEGSELAIDADAIALKDS